MKKTHLKLLLKHLYFSFVFSLIIRIITTAMKNYKKRVHCKTLIKHTI